MGETNGQNEERNGLPSVVNDDLVRNVDNKFVKDGISQFQNFRVYFHKFHALFPIRLSQARPSQVLCKMGCENAHRCIQNTENGLGLDFFRAIQQRWQ
jgi:hypothetical protein